MKTIFRIAKTELRTLFYSPIAWFLMIVFLIQCGITYLGLIESQARTMEIGGIGLQYMSNLTARIFVGRGGLFSSVMQKLYLFIPLLTMGLISREMSSGTIKLLYTSPIKVREIVFGKYLAMVIYSLLLVAIVGIFMIAGMFHITFPDGGMLVSGAIGFFLLLCAYSAIGLFMSCLTTYQVVAAVATFIMIGILSYIGTLWQEIDFVRDLTYFLSLNGRAEKMLTGLITTKDVLYFFVIVYIFLGLSIYKLRAGMESKPVLVKAGRYVAIVASALLIGYVFSLPVLTGYADLTANKSRTITPQVQKIIQDLGDEPLEVTAYNNFLGRFAYTGMPAQRNEDLSRWEPYMRFKNNIKLNYVQYYDSALDAPYIAKMYPGKTIKEIAEQYAKGQKVKMSMFKTPAEIRKMIDLRPEQNRYVMQLKWKGRTTFLRVFDDQMMWPGETEVSAALKRLQQAKLPKIAFLTGDLERGINKMGDKEYKAIANLASFRYSLMNQGFDTDTVSLETQDIPADISTLVIADPKIALTPITMAKLQQYIDKGGNLMVLGEPGRQALLNPLLKQLGVQLMDGQVVQQSTDLSPEIVTPDLTATAGTFSKSVAKSLADSQKVSMPGAVGLSYTQDSGFTVQPLLMTDTKLTWNKKQKLDLDMVTNADASGGSGTPATTPGPAPATRKMTVTPASLHTQRPAGNGAPIKMMTMTPEQIAAAKKRGDSIRTAMAAIMNGEGTPEEKKAKVQEMMMKLRNSSMQQQASVKVMQQPAPPKTVVTPKSETVVASSGGMTMSVMPAGAAFAAGPGGGDRRTAGIGTVSFSAAEGDTRGALPTVLSLTRKINGKEQRIVVAGDADFMSNSELNRFNMRTANFVFNTSLFSWLSYGEFPIDASRPDPKDKRVTVTSDGVDRLKIFYIWILPALLVAFAAILLIRRKRK
jgi:ABC-2 type transport system permease protein